MKLGLWEWEGALELEGTWGRLSKDGNKLPPPRRKHMDTDC